VNSLVSRHRNVNSWSLARAIVLSFDPKDPPATVKRELELFQAAPGELQEAVVATYDTLLSILLSNSSLLRHATAKRGLKFVSVIAKGLLIGECFLFFLPEATKRLKRPEESYRIVRLPETVYYLESQKAQARTALSSQNLNSLAKV